MYQLIFHAEATLDFAESMLWYESQQEGLSDRFKKAIDDTLSRIQDKPLLFPIVKSNFREASVPIFPYTIVYRFNKLKSHIIIAAIYHAKRNPKMKYRK